MMSNHTRQPLRIGTPIWDRDWEVCVVLADLSREWFATLLASDDYPWAASNRPYTPVGSDPTSFAAATFDPFAHGEALHYSSALFDTEYPGGHRDSVEHTLQEFWENSPTLSLFEYASQFYRHRYRSGGEQIIVWLERPGDADSTVSETETIMALDEFARDTDAEIAVTTTPMGRIPRRVPWLGGEDDA